MKLEDQVVSLELAKKLKELGFKQESIFIWIGKKPKTINDKIQYDIRLAEDWVKEALFDYVPAYTPAELGEMLTEEIETKEVSRFLIIEICIQQRWEIKYCNSRDCFSCFQAETLADAIAETLIYLKENNLIIN